MRILRAIMPVFAVFAACLVAPVWAADDESAQPVRIAQAQSGAPSGDDRPATVGDLYHFESRMDERMTRLENRMERLVDRMDVRIAHLEDRMVRMEGRMIEMFLTMLLVMIALFGLPQLPGWWHRLRANGKPAAAAGIFLVALVMITAGAAIAGGL